MAAEGPGKSYASTPWIISVLGIQFLLALTCVYLLVQLWPHPTPSMRGASENPPAEEASPAQTDTAATDTATTAEDATATSSTTEQTTTIETRVEIQKKKATPEPKTGKVPCPSCEKAKDQEWCECEERVAKERAMFEKVDQLVRFDPTCVRLFGSVFLMWHEERLLLLILLAGMMGGFIHSIRSMYWYIGNRNLVMSWLAMYAALPVVGALMALVFYMVIRGGLFSPQSSIADTSPFGFTALAALVGMFSTRAAVKLQDIFDMLLTKAEEGKDSSKNPKPTLAKISPATVTVGSAAFDLTLEGDGFVERSFVFANDTELQKTLEGDSKLIAKVPADLVATAGALKIKVVNPAPGGGESTPLDLTVT